ncbi:hypothetical protein CA233_00435 [Sphingomonas sp. ABOLD]|uniref:Uncharacterized protein n=1 Tax=Sphingomonas trueperi TaxID=53317 RepID=A0A7X5XZ76_9SPHN|nr:MULTISPECIES: hypothetical protein [Sphingomonas]NJB97678.1 hypothetical protein [Sphingomonas trueperi]RSV43510.1 hypothetical protein CA234_04730 [Sphingomonas sp. ABOLE]RSV52881.1 hypothetical protein CA233_00435 [Sphingomonas sp. ABOLD]
MDHDRGGGAADGWFDSLNDGRRADNNPASLFEPIGLANLMLLCLHIGAKRCNRPGSVGPAYGFWPATGTDLFTITAVGRDVCTNVEVRVRRAL